MNNLQKSTLVLMLTVMWLFLGCVTRKPLEIEQEMVCGNGEFEHLFVIKQKNNRADILASVRDSYTKKEYFVKERYIDTIMLCKGEHLLFEHNRTKWDEEGDIEVGPIRLYVVSGNKQTFYGAFFSLYDGESYQYRSVKYKRE